jgi:hypothetical protein
VKTSTTTSQTIGVIESPQLSNKTKQTASINANASDISNPARRSESSKLITTNLNNSVNGEDDSNNKIKRFNYESSHESESEESAVHKLRVGFAS